MATQRESLLTNRIRTAILRHWPDAWVFKVAGTAGQTGGIPDLLVCIDGHLSGLEVKCPRLGETPSHARGRVTLRQQAALDALARAGGTAQVVTGVSEALAILGAVSTRVS